MLRRGGAVRPRIVPFSGILLSEGSRRGEPRGQPLGVRHHVRKFSLEKGFWAMTATNQRWSRLCAAIGILLILAATDRSVAADRLELRSGEVLFGKLLRYNNYEISLRLESGGLLSFRRSQVSKVRLDPLTAEETARVLGIELEGEKFELTPNADLGPLPDPALLPGTDDPGAPWPSTPDDESPAKVLVGTSSRILFAPPGGFQRGEVSSEEVLESFRDAETGAVCTVALALSQEPLSTVKRSTTQSGVSEFNSFRVVRDVEFKGPGHTGWSVEVQGQIEDVAIHQLQVFTRCGADTLILTYRTPEEHWARLKQKFHASIRSLQSAEGDSDSPRAKEELEGYFRSVPLEPLD